MKRFIGVAAGVSVLYGLLFVVALTTAWIQYHYFQATEARRDSQSVLLAIERHNGAYADLQRSTRSYILSGSQQHLAEQKQAAERAERLAKELIEAFGERAKTDGDVREFVQWNDRVLAAAAELVEIREKEGLTGALDAVRKLEEKVSLQGFRALFRKTREAELAAVAAHDQSIHHWTRVGGVAGATACVLTLWLALTTPGLLRREARGRRAAEDKLRSANAELERRVEERTSELRSAYDRIEAAIQGLTSSEAVNRRQREELESIYRTAPVGLCVLDAESRFVRTNQRLAEMTGRPVGDLIGRRLRDTAPQWAEVAEPLMRRVIATGEPVLRVEFESREIGDARRVWLHSQHPVKGSAGEVTGVNMVVQEITELRRAVGALRQSEERLRLACRSARAGVWAWYPDESPVWSDEMYELLGLRPEDGPLPNEAFVQRVHPADRDAVRDGIAEYFRRGGEFSLEYRFHRPSDGAMVWVHAVGRIEHDPANAPTAAHGIMLDITARKQAELNDRLLQELDAKMRGVDDPDTIINETTRLVGEFLEGSRCFIAEAEWESGIVRLKRDWCRDLPSIEGEYAMATFVTPEFLASLWAGTPAVVADVRADARTAPFAPAFDLLNIGSFAAAPFFRDEGRRAAIFVSSTGPRGWRVDELMLCREVIARTWPLLEKAWGAKALQESEAQFRRALTHAALPVMMYTEDGEILAASEAVFAISGYHREEIRTMHDWRRAVFRADEPARSRLIEGYFREDRALDNLESTIITRNGEVRTWLVSAAPPARLSDGRKYYVAFSNDLTERKRAEEALRESEQFKNAVLNSLPAHVAVLDNEGRIIAVNEPWLEFGRENGGLDPRQIASGANYLTACRAAAHLQDDAVAAEAYEGIRQVLFDGRPHFSLEYPCDSPGTRRWFLMQVVRPSVGVGGAIVAHIDVTERRLAEEARRDSEARFRAMAETVPDIVFTNLPDGRCDYTNPRFTEVSGVQPEDALGHGWHRILHPDDLEPTATAWEESVRTGSTFEIQYRVRTVEGNYRWYLCRSRPIKDESGRVVKWFGACSDIHDLMEAERRLQELIGTLERKVAERTRQLDDRNQQLRRLASELSAAEQRERKRIALTLHDHLQQILVAARFRLDRLQTRELTPDVRKMITQADGLILEAISASRDLTVELSPPVLYDLGLGAALDWLARHFNEKYESTVHVQVDPQAEPTDPNVQAFLFQCARELLFNVVKHAETNEAWITLQRIGDDFVEVAVADHGRGFQRARNTSSQSGGVGLFSMQQRVDLLGGKFAVETAEGQGSRVALQVPINVSEVHAGNGEQATIEGPRAQPQAVESSTQTIRVLLADDHRMFRETLALVLGDAEDIEIVGEAKNGKIACELAQSIRPDVILMDVSMPIMNGIEATRAIHQDLPEIRIIGLSMHEADDLANAILEAGAECYLTKSGALTNLITAVRGGLRGTQRPAEEV